MNFGLARDQVVLLETAAKLWASRRKENDFFAVFSSFASLPLGFASENIEGLVETKLIPSLGASHISDYCYRAGVFPPTARPFIG